MNRMLRSKVLDYLNGWYHITVGRNNDGDIALLGEHIS